jgi:hypothetical protein
VLAVDRGTLGLLQDQLRPAEAWSQQQQQQQQQQQVTLVTAQHPFQGNVQHIRLNVALIYPASLFPLALPPSLMLAGSLTMALSGAELERPVQS